MRGITLFSGGGLVECAYATLDITPVAAVELDAAIAAVYRQNHGDHVRVESVVDTDFTTFPPHEIGWASPVCKNFSTANPDAGESDGDLATAEAVCRYVRICQPAAFVLENVRGYGASWALQRIVNTLLKLDYTLDWQVVDAANMGVPQNRERLILRAVRASALPALPSATPWQGWYTALADLLPDLPLTTLAAWQIPRLPTDLPTGGVLLDSKNSTQQRGKRHRLAQEPSFTITAYDRPSHLPAAFLLDSAHTSRAATVRAAHEPAMTVQAWHGRRPSQMPVAWLAAGRTVRLTPRALARLQTLPDRYQLPEDNLTLAATIIGNGVPCKLAEAVLASLIRKVAHAAHASDFAA